MKPGLIERICVEAKPASEVMMFFEMANSFDIVPAWSMSFSL